MKVFRVKKNCSKLWIKALTSGPRYDWKHFNLERISIQYDYINTSNNDNEKDDYASDSNHNNNNHEWW